MTLTEKLETKDIRVFLKSRAITNDQGAPLDFYDHPYLLDIYKDWSPRLVCKKAAQIGFSTTAIHKTFWASKNLGLDVIYSMPTANDMRDFVSSKVNRLIAHNPIYQQWTSDKDSIEQKRMGSNVIYYRGTWVERAAIAIPADLYVADEVDRSDQAVVEQFASRLQHSKFAWEWRFSNPSVPENGVDKWWNKSDQKEWFVRCEGCNRDQILSLEHIKGGIFACIKCGKELDRRKGRWIARFRDEAMSGYHISSLMAPHISAQTILDWKREKTDEFFANFVLGEPYVGKGNTLPRHYIYRCLTEEKNPQDIPPVIGVDTGKNIHIVVGNKYGIYYHEECPDYGRLEAILTRYPTALCVMDVGGDIQMPMKLREKYPHQIYLCAFVQSQGDNLIKWKEDERMVNADRNKAIQLVVDEITAQSIPFFGSQEDYELYGDHWSHLYRVVDEDERGRRRYVWERNGPDHLALATVYFRIGMDKQLAGNAELVLPTQGILPSGPSMDLQGNLTRATLKRL